LTEIEKELKLIAERYEGSGPSLFYTDNCCNDRRILSDCFPSL